jgi:DNA modification methylase
MLAKTTRNHFDMDAVRQEAKWERWGTQTVPKYAGSETGTGWMTERSKEDIHASVTDENGKRWRNLRTVWTIPTSNYPGAHYATFPPALVERCILATCPATGVVLDPFIGSGTVAMQALKMDRQAIGIDIKAEYLDQTLTRVRQRR